MTGRSTPLSPLLLSVVLSASLVGCTAQWSTEDVDGDGVSIADGDCWDRVEGPDGSGLSGADIYPGADEDWYDGYDQDCAEDDDYDADGDGYVLDAFVGATTYGVGGTGGLPGGDCWDDPGSVPDGYLAAGGYAQLDASEVNPGVPAEADTWYDGIDADCLGNSDFDQDGDGFDSADDPAADGTTGGDCDDVDDEISPDAQEVCDDVDNDCDDLVDGADDSVDQESIRTWFEDLDDDGYGTTDTLLQACDQPDGYVEEDGDCDDGDDAINPAADELCNELDDDCNGTVDEAAVDAPSWYVDADLDGFGSDTDVVAACDQPDGFVDNDDDCDDGDSDVNPDADELCSTDGVDDDCDGDIDEADASDVTTWYSDLDDDGYGLTSLTTQACDEPTGFSAESGDCDDTDGDISPGADELCSTVGVDDDCDGDADEADAADAGTFYEDGDEDGYGDPDGDVATGCDTPDGYADNAGDCDDSCDSCWTDAEEICNDYLDNDCDGTANECAIDTIVDLAGVAVVLSGSDSNGDFGLDLDGGDLDGDGQVDMIVGARDAGSGGQASVFLGPLDTALSSDAADVTLSAESSGDKAGRAVALADLDGDDYDDIVVTATSGGTGSARGTAYVVYGPVSADLDLGDADWSITAPDNWTYLGRNALDLGDVSGDGLDDFVVSSESSDITASNSGSVFVFAGAGSGAEELDGATATIPGAASGDKLGRSVAGVGDIDGDGVGDMVVGAWQSDEAGTDAGAAYLYLGPVSGELSSTDADATFQGESAGDYAGDSVHGGGDLDGDGTPDVVVGAYNQSSSALGAAYVVYGTASPTDVALGSADAIIRGEDSSQRLGIEVEVVGDVDMDGVDDLAVGEGGRDDCNSSSGLGHTYLFYGDLAGSYTSSDADSDITGADEGDCAGARAGGFGDLDGDGYPDVTAGAPGADGTGAVYVIPGIGM